MNADFLQKLPKAELHVHIEGTLEPEHYLFFAERNKIKIPYTNVDQVRKALYTFHDLTSFINVYNQAASIISTEQDFFDLTYAYLKKVAQQGVIHAEIFFDIQNHQHMSFDQIINGIYHALAQGYKDFKISSGLILTFLRDRGVQEAISVFNNALHYRDKIIGVGLASVENGYPPAPFASVFERAKTERFHCVAHAGEEAGPEYIWQALDVLKVERVDHGIRCMDDPSLVRELVARKIPLTVCPLSNVALGCVKTLPEHPLKKMFDAGLMVTINSDDPAFFGGYCADNYQAAYKNMAFSVPDLITCARNSFLASFASQERKKECLRQLDDYCAGFKNGFPG